MIQIVAKTSFQLECSLGRVFLEIGAKLKLQFTALGMAFARFAAMALRFWGA